MNCLFGEFPEQEQYQAGTADGYKDVPYAMVCINSDEFAQYTSDCAADHTQQNVSEPALRFSVRHEFFCEISNQCP